MVNKIPLSVSYHFFTAGGFYLAQLYRPPLMNNTLNLLIVVLIIGWLAGFFAFPNVGGIIHLLLVIALILVVYRLVTGRKIN